VSFDEFADIIKAHYIALKLRDQLELDDKD